MRSLDLTRIKQVAKISNITLQKNNSRANVFLDGEFVCGLNTLTLVKNGLKQGTEITKEKLMKIYNESEIESAYEKAISLLSRQKYTQKAITDKLKAKGYETDVIDIVINKLKEYGYISDTAFATSFVNCNNSKSKRMLEINLLQKGISREVIKQVIDENTTLESEREKCTVATNKYMKNKEINDVTIKKLKAHLLYKGFSFEDINYCIKNLGGEIEDD